MIQKIRLYGDPVLFESCDTVVSMGDREKTILVDMWDTMLHNNCVGLSAPQIGVKSGFSS